MTILGVIASLKSKKKKNPFRQFEHTWFILGVEVCLCSAFLCGSDYQRMFIIWIQSLMGTIDSAPATVMTEKSMSETAGNSASRSIEEWKAVYYSATV